MNPARRERVSRRDRYPCVTQVYRAPPAGCGAAFPKRREARSIRARSTHCRVMRLGSQLDCRSSETRSILVCGAKQRHSIGRRPWWPSGFQIRRTRFDSSPTCHGIVRKVRTPALQAGFPGAVPGDSTKLAVVAPRRSNRSVRDRARFDSVRRLRGVCSRRTTALPTQQARFDSGTPLKMQVWLEGRASVCQSDGAGSIPATCSSEETARCSGSNMVCKTMERGSTPRRASKCFRPRPGPASSKRRDARSTRAGSSNLSHSSSGPGRWILNPATRVRFPHATLTSPPTAGSRSTKPARGVRLLLEMLVRLRAATPPSLRRRHSLRSGP